VAVAPIVDHHGPVADAEEAADERRELKDGEKEVVQVEHLELVDHEEGRADIRRDTKRDGERDEAAEVARRDAVEEALQAEPLLFRRRQQVLAEPEARDARGARRARADKEDEEAPSRIGAEDEEDEARDDVAPKVTAPVIAFLTPKKRLRR